MTSILQIFLVHVFIVYVIDVSGFVDEIKKRLRLENKSLKPFDCSTCMTVWYTLFHSYFLAEFSIFTCLGVTVAFAIMPVITERVILSIKGFLELASEKLLNKIDDIA